MGMEINKKQQVPSGKVGKMIRGCFKAGPGCELMSVDWENLEVWIGAYLMGDTVLQRILEEGHNFHDFNTTVFFGLEKPSEEEFEAGTPAAEKWNMFRNKLAKVIVFARINNIVLIKFR